ncbi:MAG: hypothetical protein ACK4E0_06495 [Chitinophagaceae bacterium]
MRLKSTLVFLFLIVCVTSFAQKTGLKESVELNAGISEHGSGDYGGFMLNTEYRRYYRERIFFAMGIGASWHDGAYGIKYIGPSGQTVDGSVREVTAGYQLSAKIGYDFIQNDQHSFGLMLGPLLRYQTSTLADGVSIYYPVGGSSYPFPVVAFDHRSPQRTTSFGGILQLSFRHKLNSRIFIGATAGFQTDTNGDAITQGCALLGVRI